MNYSEILHRLKSNDKIPRKTEIQFAYNRWLELYKENEKIEDFIINRFFRLPNNTVNNLNNSTSEEINDVNNKIITELNIPYIIALNDFPYDVQAHHYCIWVNPNYTKNLSHESLIKRLESMERDIRERLSDRFSNYILFMNPPQNRSVQAVYHWHLFLPLKTVVKYVPLDNMKISGEVNYII